MWAAVRAELDAATPAPAAPLATAAPTPTPPPAAPPPPPPIVPLTRRDRTPEPVETKVAWPAVVCIVLVFAMAAAVAMLWRQTDRLAADQRAAEAEAADLLLQLRQQVEDQNQMASGINDRLQSVEARTSDTPDNAEVAALVRQAVFKVVAGPAQGSGFFLSEGERSDVLVTNFHVVAEAWDAGVREVEVVRADGLVLPGTIEDVNADVDLALIHVADPQPALRRADADPKVGDGVMAIGSPQGLDGSVSTGIVSAVRNEGGYRFIQFSAPVSPGSSGGPVVNATGEVIGVTVAKLVGDGVEGVSFAIPIGYVCTAVGHCD
jgi:putative serine protease PepD